MVMDCYLMAPSLHQVWLIIREVFIHYSRKIYYICFLAPPPPFLGLWKLCIVLTPVFDKNGRNVSYFNPFFHHNLEKYSFDPFLALLSILRWEQVQCWASLSKTHLSTPPSPTHPPQLCDVQGDCERVYEWQGPYYSQRRYVSVPQGWWWKPLMYAGWIHFSRWRPQHTLSHHV